MAELRPYEPTWRDRIAQMMMGDGRASPERRRFVEGLLGSSGLGNTGMGVVDVTPVGGLLQAQEAVSEGDPRGAALAVLPIPGAARAQRAANVAADVATPQGIRAYHGSPYNFDRFDLSKIGTGVGAQAYGHGLYFAENPALADKFRKTINTEQFNDPAARAWSFVDSFGSEENAIKAANIAIEDKQLRDLVINELKSKNYKNFNPKGHGYEVNIRANPEDFLDWDKPLSEQSEAVRRALTPEGLRLKVAGPEGPWNGKRVWTTTEGNRIGPSTTAASPPSRLFSDNEAPAAIYRSIGGDDPQMAAQILREAGIPGVKYIDQTAPVANEARNYVVFDENLIDILRKYGLVPGMIGGGAAANSFGLLGPEGSSEY